MNDDLMVTRRRLEAAEIEVQAAQIRLETARMEQEATKRTLAMADAVAQSMYYKQMGTRA